MFWALIQPFMYWYKSEITALLVKDLLLFYAILQKNVLLRLYCHWMGHWFQWCIGNVNLCLTPTFLGFGCLSFGWLCVSDPLIPNQSSRILSFRFSTNPNTTLTVFQDFCLNNFYSFIDWFWFVWCQKKTFLSFKSSNI